ncbi:MAG: hypothetical protein JXB35_04230 [Anaerolineae bacterium]|nr:hypothetical protein [Anaerolineae bacterium]
MKTRVIAVRKTGFAVCLLIIAFAGVLFPVPMAAGQQEPSRQFYTLVNQVRLGEGLPPLSWSTLLAQAAQRHADDMAANTIIDTVGSDGSTYRQRIREAGYRAWDDGLLVYETLWAGLGFAENALNWFLQNPEQWSAFVDSRYREVGVGYAEDGQGVHYFVISFGSRPGVLPIFINDGADTTDNPQVAIRLTNEEAEPLGEGNWIGEAIEVRLGNSPDLGDSPWQAWEPLLPWVLDGTSPGDYAVYAEFRDGAGRTTINEDTIRMTAPGEAPAATEPRPDLPTPIPTGTPEATEMPATGEAETSTATTEAAPTDAVTPAATEIIATPSAPQTAPPQPTWTPLPSIEEPVVETTVDWPLILVILLQAAAVALGFALFLRRNS